MKNAPSRFNAAELTQGWPAFKQLEVQGEKKMVPGRPVGKFGLVHRIKMAWSVFTGKADAVFWEGQ
jgi:hypothetical protein